MQSNFVENKTLLWEGVKRTKEGAPAVWMELCKQNEYWSDLKWNCGTLSERMLEDVF